LRDDQFDVPLIGLRLEENPLKEFLKTTAVGGIVFLLPLALTLLILAHAWRLAKHVTVPLSHSLHLDRLGSIAGIGASTALAVLLLVLVAFASGLIARTNTGKRITRWSEDSFLGRMPQYQLMKSMAEGLAQIENAGDLRPVLVNIEEGWQIGYQLETLDAEWVAVFVPS